MKLISLILREILGLFIDDKLLALGILAVVAASGIAETWSQALAGAILFLGSLLAVTSSIIKTARKP